MKKAMTLNDKEKMILTRGLELYLSQVKKVRKAAEEAGMKQTIQMAGEIEKEVKALSDKLL